VKQSRPTITSHAIDAVLFDLDGVVTRTAKQHAAAWQELFDSYLRQRARRENTPVQPFDVESDYQRYVDGKPRHEGVESFLRSRGINLPYGDPADSPDQESICGLGNKKNLIFRQLLESQGVEVFDSTVALIRRLRSHGFKTAIVSSSKNCAAVLEAAGLVDLFDTRADGTDIARLQIKGKPAPDIFLLAAERLGVAPARAAVVEDAIAGVQAGRNGRFQLVIGVASQGNPAALRDNGAHIVVSDIAEMDVEDADSTEKADSTVDSKVAPLPKALEHLEDIRRQLDNKDVVVFLDYDGTLTPIVDRPDQALLSSAMRQTLRDLASCCPVAIISGRDRADVQELVHIDAIVYAGSHGFDIADPQNRQVPYEMGTTFGPLLEEAETALRQKLAAVEGAFVEPKKFSLAVHFRNAAQADEAAVEAIVDDVLTHYPDLRKGRGKKVFDLQPRINWHKGKAVLWLLQALQLDGTNVLPIYIGDDLTDEDAFKALAQRGIGIVVEDSARPTAASYVLKNPIEVQVFLRQLTSWLER
jgi:trehalose 6-phosphate phosphatase